MEMSGPLRGFSILALDYYTNKKLNFFLIYATGFESPLWQRNLFPIYILFLYTISRK